MKPDSSRQDPDITKILKGLESHKAEYPEDLLAARRAAFLRQVDQKTKVEIQQEVTPQEQEITQLFAGLRSLEAAYPENLLAARRSAFKHQILRAQPASFWQKLRLAIYKLVSPPAEPSQLSPANVLRTSFVVAAVLVALAGFLLHENRTPSASLATTEQGQGISQAGAIVGTTTPEVEKIICKPGFVPPLCLAREFDQSKDLTFQGNGSARPAVAKDTLPGYGEIHQSAFVNDGLYGPGASWVSNSKNSWIKIDLGKPTSVNTVTFGRDRLGKLNDGDPGRFTVAVALKDNVYADGNSTNDNIEYKQVYDSAQAGFDGEISGAETVMAQFETTPVRFVKLTFENAGTAIDEVEVFLLKTPPTAHPTKATHNEPRSTATPVPTSTPLPTATPLPTFTDTPLPTDTETPEPTWTPVPTDTPTDEPTSTPVPTDTPQPTDTPFPIDITEIAPLGP
jgi:hypothetical protein